MQRSDAFFTKGIFMIDTAQTQKSIFPTFLKYVSANVLGMIGFSCYILADTFFIARGIGSDALAALNLTLPAYSLMNGTGLMIGMGGAADTPSLLHILTAGRTAQCLHTHCFWQELPLFSSLYQEHSEQK